MIRNPEFFARASEWVGSLILYPNGAPRCTDFDLVSQHGKKFIIVEAKKIIQNQLFLPYGQFKTLQELHFQLKEPHFFLVGTLDYSMNKDEDPLWIVDFNRILNKNIPYRRTKHGGIILNSEDMTITTRKLFSEVCNFLLNE